MERFQRIETADWVGNVRFRLRFADGAAGVVDLDANALQLLLRAEQAAAEQVSGIRVYGAASLSGLATD